MSDNDIVKMLRMIQGKSLWVRVWQHYMLNAAHEIEQNRIDLQEYRLDVEALTEERDRLKAALVRLRDCDWVTGSVVGVDGIRQIAREALEAKE
jgi:selenocysteine lyase/cysteine desulfurase